MSFFRRFLPNFRIDLEVRFYNKKKRSDIWAILTISDYHFHPSFHWKIQKLGFLLFHTTKWNSFISLLCLKLYVADCLQKNFKAKYMPILLYWEFKKWIYFSKFLFTLSALFQKFAISKKQFLFQFQMLILTLFCMASPWLIPVKIDQEGWFCCTKLPWVPTVMYLYYIITGFFPSKKPKWQPKSGKNPEFRIRS